MNRMLYQLSYAAVLLPHIVTAKQIIKEKVLFVNSFSKIIIFLLGLIKELCQDILAPGDTMKLWEDIVIICIGGTLYVMLEHLWRGYSHWSMFLVGGLCFLLIGRLDTWNPAMPVAGQAILGSCIVTAMELTSGMIFNVWLGMNVWDYSSQPLNFRGQICLTYFVLWIPVSVAAIFTENFVRKLLFSTPLPSYRWF